MINTSSTKKTRQAALRYDANRDLVWLLARPWIWIPRFLQIVVSLLILTLRIVFQGSSEDVEVHKTTACAPLT